MKMFQVDAFTDVLFCGNPAAVLVLEDWLPEARMQQIALENNLAETAFCKVEGDSFALRWFTPAVEVAFCGHATLATAHVLTTEYGFRGEMRFATREVGELRVSREGDHYRMELPVLPPEPMARAPEAIAAMLPVGAPVFRSFGNIFVELESEAEVREFVPDLGAIATLGREGLCITAKGVECDFVSRYFAPGAGIDEDPVTGSNHATLVPWWAGRLGRNVLQARQVSARGGVLGCELTEENVILFGQAVTYMAATIRV